MNFNACQQTVPVGRGPAATPLLCAEDDSELWPYQYALGQFTAVALTNLSGQILDVNDRFCQLLQYRREELLGQSYSQFQSRMQSEAAAHSLKQAIAAGQPWQGEILNRARDGSRCWVKTSVVPQRDASGKIHRYLFASQDVTEQKRWIAQQQRQRQSLIQQRALNQNLQVRLDGNNHILHLIANGVPLEESLTAIAELTETLSSELHCAIMVVDPKRGELFHRAAPSLPRSFVEMMDELPITPQGGAFAAAAHGNRTIIVADIAADTQAHYVNDLALAHGLRACWASPILVRGKVVAVLGIYYAHPQYPSETDQRLIARAMELTQVAMERHRSEAALRSKLEETLLLREITQKIRQSLDNEAIFHTTVTQVRSLLQADRVAIAHLAPPDQRPEAIADPLEDNEPDEIVAAALALAAAKAVPRFIAEDVQAPFDSILELEDCANELWLSQPETPLVPAPACDLAPWDTEPDSLLPSKLKVIEDIYYADLGDEQIALLERLQIQACITLPIIVGGHPWGILCIQQCSAPRQWQSSELSFLQEITAQLSVAIQQANHLNQAQQKSERLQQLLNTVQEQKHQQARAAVRERLVSRMIQQIHQTRDIAEILVTATEETRNLLKCEHVLVYRFRPDWSREIAHESCLAGCTPLMDQQQHFSWVDHQLQLHQGGRYRDRESAIVMDIYQSGYSEEHIACLERRGIRAFMVVPIFTGEQLWGLMGAYQSGHPRDWSFEDLSFLERISGQLGVAFQQAELLKQLEQAKEKADSANQAKGTFLAHMSHELRTPLNAILGFSQLMHREPETTPSQRETLNIINRSGNHLLSLINDILELSKIEAGKLVLQETDLDLFSLCDSIHDLFSLKAQSKGLALHFERAMDVPQYIHCDERKLKQILMNLISNSLKFTHQGSITLKIWCGDSLPLDPMTSLSNAPIQLWFSIQDSGEGIADQDMAQLFDAFSQTESGRSLQEGSGLGLPISREFVQLMGGRLTLESKRHRGTEARFSIVVPPVVGKFILSPVNQRVISLAPNQPTYRILVVEDRQENRKLLTQLLEWVGFSVRTATNGELAIAQWQDWKPHLIWTDLQMPVMNGFEATRRIRHLEAMQRQTEPAAALPGEPSPAIPAAASEAIAPLKTTDRETFILAITASAFEETRTLTLEAGFDDFIRKPYSESLIFDKIAQYLGAEYCYEPLEAASAPVSARLTDSSQAPSQANLTQQVQAMAPSWRQALYHAAITLDEAALQQQIQDIDPAYGLLKTLLQNWAQLLRLDKIAALMAEVEMASTSMPAISTPNST